VTYTGKLWGKVGRRTIPLKMTSEDVDSLERERDEVLKLLKTVHEWFMQKAPEHYNGCGLWIDVDLTIKDWEKGGES